MSWDPDIYLAFASERTRPAAELLARIPLQAPERVADLGCGPGNSTALLAARWPSARIDGIESSPDMLKKARVAGIRADFIEADVATWQPADRYDVVYANATLQWIEDHETLLPRLLGFVKDGGVLAFQMPRNFDAPSHALMRETASAGPWREKLAKVRRIAVLEPEAYYDILRRHAGSLDIWESEYLHVLEGEDPVFHWVSGTGLRPFADALAGTEREEFLAAYKTGLRAAYPRRSDGYTLFPFRRIFAVAVR